MADLGVWQGRRDQSINGVGSRRSGALPETNAFSLEIVHSGEFSWRVTS